MIIIINKLSNTVVHTASGSCIQHTILHKLLVEVFSCHCRANSLSISPTEFPFNNNNVKCSIHWNLAIPATLETNK